MKLAPGLTAWSLVSPFAAAAVLAALWGDTPGWAGLALIGIALVVAVFVSVHHAEVIAHRVGEPYGTLVLAVAVTVIEVALIVSVMLSGAEGASTLPRDTVYATVMIVCNGVVGLCLLAGAIRHHVMIFRVEGTSPALTVVIALTTLTLVLPTLTTTTLGPTFSPAQLVFSGVMSLVLYAIFVFVQTVRHRDYFLPVQLASSAAERHAPPPLLTAAWSSAGLLCVALVTVVGLGKLLAPAIKAGVEAAGAPGTVVGIAIAALVLTPETWAAVRAALRNRMQTSLNLALGSALATIGLTIPVVTVVSLALDLRLELGLPAKEIALLALTFLISALTLASGRATVLQGAVHLVLFATFVFFAVIP